MSDLWIFAYGSLMWKPGFTYGDLMPARMDGVHRSLCIYSINHRGTRKNPGLVLGLDRSGTCYGIAYRIEARAVRNTMNYLHRREMITKVYKPATRTARLLDGSGVEVPVLTYLVDRRHPQYTGGMPLERQAVVVRYARGKSGANIDYVVNTVNHLRAMGIHDERLERLMVKLGRSSHLIAGPQTALGEPC